MVRVFRFVQSSLACLSCLLDTNMLLRRRQASEHQKETLDGRDGVSLACHLRALSWLARVAHRSKRIACSMLSYCLEMNIWGWIENDLISPKTQKRKSARNG